MKNYLKSLICLLAAIILLGGLAGCAGRKQADENRISVVTTIFPIYDFARAVGRSNINLKMLVKPGTEVHSYEPTPQDIIDIRKADVFIYIGGENDAWVDDVLESVENEKQVVIKLIDVVNTYEEEAAEGMAGAHDHEEAEDHETDEHIWTSQENAKIMVSAVAGTLAEVDPSRREYYYANAEAYNKEIDGLIREFAGIVAEGARNKWVFGDRFPMLYFTKEYGLDYRGAFSGCSAQCEESAGAIVYLINYIKENDIPVVYYIEMSSRNIADVLCEETGAEALLFHSCQAISKEDFEAGETYVSIMKKNADSLRKGLR